ncbi:hypothetical protein HD599_001682 [Conyzicola lurida]|uniref:Cyclophilin-like domain-containing protein n=1 Tax=Conyzicola lurida TaxID=1172621 RepID=A0A841APL7_9MICO|nr:cyclophilin-like fold protein [Conyzicola lurida]MBB5843359.1 hypothetical protein [Conyzicola lurida]
MKRILPTLIAVALLSGCAPAPGSSTRQESGPSTTRERTSAPTPVLPTGAPHDVVGTVVRFSSDRTSVDVTVDQDTPAVREFLSVLPLELVVEEFNGKEKIAYLPRELDAAETPGSDPEDGDLIYFTPWGNLGFFYDATGIGYTDQTLHIGTFTAGREELALLETGAVTVAVVEE